LSLNRKEGGFFKCAVFPLYLGELYISDCPIIIAMRHVARAVKRLRRAVSPIIATLILVVVTVAIAVLFYLWLTGFFTAFMGGAGTFGSLRSTGVAECIDTTNGIFKIGLRAELGDVILDRTITVVLPTGTSTTLTFQGNSTNPPTDVTSTGWYIYDPSQKIGPDPNYGNLYRVPSGTAFVIYVRLDQSFTHGQRVTFRVGVVEGGGPGDITITV